MGKFIDLRGRRFGRLVVTGMAGKTSSGNYRWKVLCDCGKRKEAVSSHLLRKEDPVLSCGCYRNDRIRQVCSQSPKKTAFNLLFASYRKNACGKNKEFLLSELEFTELTKSNCRYCGKEPSQIIQNRPKTGTFVYNGIDRIDSGIGYVTGNCAACCKRCNYLKSALSEKIFKEKIVEIYNFWAKHESL